MSAGKIIKLQATLKSGHLATFYLGGNNFVLHEDKDGVKLCDGVHNNGGWTLAKTETLAGVTARIDKALEAA